jgi:hypothetical protein
VPWIVGFTLIALVYTLGLSLGWSNGALGVGGLIACVAGALVRGQMAGHFTRR